MTKKLVVGLDVCVPTKIIKSLETNNVLCICAEHAEADRDWFKRALDAKAACIVSADSDLEILCYDNHIPFVHWKPNFDVGELLLKVTDAVAA